MLRLIKRFKNPKKKQLKRKKIQLNLKLFHKKPRRKQQRNLKKLSKKLSQKLNKFRNRYKKLNLLHKFHKSQSKKEKEIKRAIKINNKL